MAINNPLFPASGSLISFVNGLQLKSIFLAFIQFIMRPSLSRFLPIVIAALTGSAAYCEADVFSKVPEAAEYGVAYEISIPLNGGFRDAVAVPYAINNSATVLPFDRVAYYLELTAANGSVTWAYASMDAFTTVASQLGLPHNVSNPVSFQQEVKNLTVRSNVAGVQTGAFDTGNLEIFPANYSAANALAVFSAPLALRKKVTGSERNWATNSEPLIVVTSSQEILER
jgi:hypothetical protein